MGAQIILKVSEDGKHVAEVAGEGVLVFGCEHGGGGVMELQLVHGDDVRVGCCVGAIDVCGCFGGELEQ